MNYRQPNGKATPVRAGRRTPNATRSSAQLAKAFAIKMSSSRSRRTPTVVSHYLTHLCSVWQLRMHSEQGQDPLQQNCNHMTEAVGNFGQRHSESETINNTIPNI
jgi:hypothetical protein